MEDIVCFTHEGKTYAKGFFNQNGHSFYVLRGHVTMFEERVETYLGTSAQYYLEISDELPGPEVCPPEVP